MKMNFSGMLCGSSSNEKAGCFSAGPKSPASTAGQSTPRSSSGIQFASPLIWSELKEEVLLLSATAWKYPLVTPEEIARLSRSISSAQKYFLSPGISVSAVVSWRIFQAADNTYQGYVSERDLQRVVRGVLPQSGLESDIDSFSDAPLVFWDVIAWWRELELTEKERQVLENFLIKRVIVPSDGLWAGLSVCASVRVWKSVCRSVGHLFRFQAQSFVESTFKAIQSEQGLLRADLLSAEKEVLMYLIGESMGRIYSRGRKLWIEFSKQDHDGDGLIKLEAATHILKKLNVNNRELWHIPPLISRSAASQDESYITTSCRVSLVQLVDALSETLKFSSRISSDQLVSRRFHITDFLSNFYNFFVSSILSYRKSKSASPTSSTSVKVLLRQYLDLEQWRGQKAAQLCSIIRN